MLECHPYLGACKVCLCCPKCDCNHDGVEHEIKCQTIFFSNWLCAPSQGNTSAIYSNKQQKMEQEKVTRSARKNTMRFAETIICYFSSTISGRTFLSV